MSVKRTMAKEDGRRIERSQKKRKLKRKRRGKRRMMKRQNQTQHSHQTAIVNTQTSSKQGQDPSKKESGRVKDRKRPKIKANQVRLLDVFFNSVN